MILASIYWIFGFLRMGTSGLVAQAHGGTLQLRNARPGLELSLSLPLQPS